MGGNLITKLIKHRKFTIFFTVLAILWGMYGYYMVPKQESPDVSAPFAVIKTIYPGASPEDVEKLVTRVIEDKVTEVPGFKTSQSQSRNSVSVVVLEIDKEVDIDKSWAELRNLMDDAQKEIPAECFSIETDTKLSETAGMIISLSGENYSYEQLTVFAEDYKKELSKIKGISRFTVDGEQKKEAKVEVRIADLNRVSLSLEDLVNLLKVQNLEIPSGAIDNGEIKINVSTPGMFNSLSDIENTIINVSKNNGSIVRLKDIATVSWDLEESNYKIKQNGKNAIFLSGYFNDNENILLIGKEVRLTLDSLQKNLPEGLTVEEVIYQPIDVEYSVSEFFDNLLEGIALVLVVVFLGMGIKNAIVASTAVPLSILLNFIFMYGFNIKVTEVSIAGLIIALGMLVDDAIVIIDSIQVYIDEGMDKFKACVEGTKRALLPVFASTLTTAAAFAPMLYVPGPAGEFLRGLPLVVIISVSASFLVSITVTPALAYMFFDKLKAKDAKRGTIIRKFYELILQLGMKHKKVTSVILLVFLGISLYLGTFLGLEFFPKADKNYFYINVRSEQATDVGKTEQLAKQVEAVLKEQQEVTSYSTAIGGGLPKFYLTVPKSTPSQDFAQIMVKVDLKKGGRFKNNKEMVVYLQDALDTTIVGGSAYVELLEKAMPGTPLEVRISGEDQSKVTKAVKLITDELTAIPGTLNVDNDLEAEVYEFLVDIDTDKATSIGITKYDIQRQINIALKGTEASVFRKAGNEYSIKLISDIKSKEELENLAVKSSIAGNKVLLKQFSEIKLVSKVPAIKKYDKERAVSVFSEVKPGYSAVGIEQTLKQKLSEHSENLDGIKLAYDGEAKDINDNFGNLGAAAVFTLFGIYVILMLQFKSFLQPLIIFITIPLSLIGVIYGLLIFRQPLSFTALVGVVSLMGVVIKNAILLIEFINEARREGLSIEQACYDAVSKRYRPIVLSATTTVIGLVPLVMSGSDLFVPLSIALMSGLLVSTFLTLGVIPVIYSMMHNETSYKQAPVGNSLSH